VVSADRFGVFAGRRRFDAKAALRLSFHLACCLQPARQPAATLRTQARTTQEHSVTVVTPLPQHSQVSVLSFRFVALVAAAALGVTLCGGCKDGKTNNPSDRAQHASFSPQELPGGSFMVAWRAPLPMPGGDEINHLYRRGDQIFAYTKHNKAYVLSAAGGEILWGGTAAGPRDTLRPPVRMKDVTIFPTSSTLEIWKDGKKQRSLDLTHALRSGLFPQPDTTLIYAGLDYPAGGRIAKIDTAREHNPIRWELMTRGGVSAMPVYYRQSIYAGGEDGAVYALNESREPIWSTPGNVFQTAGPIMGDLKADDSGLYVASGDSKLYVLELATGKIKWQYFGGAPLTVGPVLTADSVYQAVPRGGVAALDKATGSYDRAARWVAPGTLQFLAEDAAAGCVYLRRDNNTIVGVDKKSGEPRYESRRTDLVQFATNTQDGIVYAASKDGTVLAIRAVPRAGTVGEQVRAEPESQARDSVVLLSK
jgi:outer membrane protein assembly factor BamB